MLRFLVSRLIQSIVVLLIVSAITFSLLSAAGGDALTVLSSNPVTSQQTLARLRKTYGLDRPLYYRYASWLGNLLQGDMGQSSSFDAPVSVVLKPRTLATVELTVTALALAILASFVLGVAAARWPGGVMDRVSSAIVVVASSLPRIVTALFALAIVVEYALFSLGRTDAGDSSSLFRLTVTAIVLAMPLFAVFLSQIQDGLKETMKADFVTVARAKGLSESGLLLHHALRNTLNPVITISGFALGGLVSGSVIVETVLGWPGLGQLSILAVRGRDVPLLMGLVLVSAAFVLAGNVVADLLLFVNDPRIRSGVRFRQIIPGRKLSHFETVEKS